MLSIVAEKVSERVNAQVIWFRNLVPLDQMLAVATNLSEHGQRLA